MPATARQLLFAAAPAETTDAIASNLTPPEHVMEWWSALPEPDWRGSGSPGDEELLERFVTAPEVVLRVGLAEALDHLRHAHLWEARRERVRARELAERVFGPLAPRAHPVLERRFQWWIRRVGQGGGRFE